MTVLSGCAQFCGRTRNPFSKNDLYQGKANSQVESKSSSNSARQLPIDNNILPSFLAQCKPESRGRVGFICRRCSSTERNRVPTKVRAMKLAIGQMSGNAPRISFLANVMLLGILLVTRTEADRAIYRYNAGGKSVSGETEWLPSTKLEIEGSWRKHETGRRALSMDSSVPAGTPIEVFYTEIFKPCTFNFNHLGLEGLYQVQLYFMETWGGSFQPGSRVFDVLINGETVLSNYDVVTEVGPKIGAMKAFSVDTTGGLSVSLAKVKSAPSIKGIALVPLCTGSSQGNATVVSCEVPSTPPNPIDLTLPHPADISIMQDFGGAGDGDLWLPGASEFVVSDTRVFSANVPIDMSSEDLPEGVPMKLFQSSIFTDNGDLELAIPLRKETYVVTLLFADVRNQLQKGREMDIVLEGEVVLAGFQPVKGNGYNTAVAKEFNVEVADGELNIALTESHGRPWLCGLKIVKLVKGHEATFLHVVIDNSPVFLDQDGSGSEDTSFAGAGSHTHEPSENLLDYFEWDIDGDVLATTQNLTVGLPLGSHRVGLTIFDTKTPSETLYSSSQVTVAPLTNVPGVLIKSYFDDSGSESLLAPLGNVEAGYAEVEALFTAPPAKRTGRIYQIVTSLVVKDTPALFKLTPVGGATSIVLLDGAVASPTEFKLLSPGAHSVEARFRVTASDQWPISLLRYKQEGPERLFDFTELEYDLTGEAPVVNDIFPKRGSHLGGQSIFIEGIGFSPKSSLEVKWGSTTIPGSAIAISPMGDQLQFIAPGGEIGELQVKVKTGNGVSSSVSFFAEMSGPLPVQFTEPRQIMDLTTWKEKTTRVTWGPDGRLYVGTLIGRIYVLTVDENYEVVEYEQLVGVSDQTSHLLLGLAFNPAQNGPDVLYLAHGTINAQGGKCHEGRDAPYTGKISLLTAPNYDELTPLITGLPVSNHDHAINGIEFDTEGNLYVMVGGNTNAGIVDCALGELDESPLSAAMIKAPVLKNGFKGDIRYVNRFNGEEDMDQKNGLDAEVVPGADIEVYATGFRNAYDLVFTQSGHLYVTDNGPNIAFGARSTGANTTGAAAAHGDELLYITKGSYYGHPNRNRGRLDDRQNKYYGLTEASIPGVFEQTIQKLAASSNGIDEYRSNTFNGALRGQLIIQQFNKVTYNVKLNPDGKTVDKLFSSVIPAMGALDIIVGPGGALIGGVLPKGVFVSTPIVDTDATEARIYDIYPYRTLIGKGAPFIMSGHGFLRVGQFELFIGDYKAQVGNYTDRRIYGTFPETMDMPAIELQDVKVVPVEGEPFIYEKGIQFLVGKDMQQAPRVKLWSSYPELPVALGEVISAVVGDILFVMGQGSPHTLGFDLITQTWLPVDTYKPRLNPGHHHTVEVYDEKIYLLGGLGKASGAKIQIFDPATNTWSYGADIPNGAGSANSMLLNDHLYFCGGIFYTPGVGTDTQSSCSVYNALNDTWSTNVALMPHGRNHAASVKVGSKMYVIGGRIGGNNVGQGFADVQIYDSVNNIWEDASATGSVDRLPVPRGGLGKAVYHNGLIYVIGGEASGGKDGKLSSPKKVFSRVDILNLATGKWTRGQDMRFGMHGHWPVKHDGKIYVAGGGVKVAGSQSSTFFVMKL